MSFEDKKKALFSCLESAEKSIAADSVLHQEKNVNYNRRRRDRESSDGRRDNRSTGGRGISPQDSVRKFRGKESIFKRPAAPISKCLPSSRLPDFKKNPQKWTKYTLEDVDTSERSNTAAAFSFLREIETQKQEQQEDDVESGGASSQFRSKVKFNRSIKLKSKLEDGGDLVPSEEDKPKVKGSKVLMPEYVIGQKIKKPKAVKLGSVSSKLDRSKQLKLDHLMDDEEEEEQGEDDDGME